MTGEVWEADVILGAQWEWSLHDKFVSLIMSPLPGQDILHSCSLASTVHKFRNIILPAAGHQIQDAQVSYMQWCVIYIYILLCAPHHL